tara:strand:+ start:1418 stop:2317 length:900 start_codon:yes stop_codon:yes gene_type:complete
MIIEKIPGNFQPNYISRYPSYSSGKNMEEIFYEYFLKEHTNIKTDLIYLPIFWTSYYVTNGYGERNEPLYGWLDKLDKNKKYFTIVQYASGIYIKKDIPNLIIFSAGGGGLNIRSHCMKEENFYNLTRHIFYGNTADYTIPLICLPSFPCLNLERDIFCSFMGRFDTHKCRFDMRNSLKNNNKFVFYDSVGYEQYKKILNQSVFTLAPRGFGYTSFRIYEAILAGSIPIYIWENKKILPFENILNWEEFSIVINSNELKNLPNLLEKCNISKMQEKLKEVKQYFSFEGTFDYIKKTIHT